MRLIDHADHERNLLKGTSKQCMADNLHRYNSTVGLRYELKSIKSSFSFLAAVWP